MEKLVHTPISTSISKLEKRQLSLVGRILAANSLILSTIWYVLTLWAGDLAFLTKLQRLIETFVWVGRSRVNRDTITQSKHNGGLGLILIIERYRARDRAIAGNMMIWVMGQENHPLRLILRSHIKGLSMAKWGNHDFTWMMTQGGGHGSQGSAVWRNLCKAWSSLKPLLLKSTPRNAEEWGLLPLWTTSPTKSPQPWYCLLHHESPSAAEGTCMVCFEWRI